MALLSTLKDNFDDGIINASLWNTRLDGVGTVTESGSTLNIVVPSNSSTNDYGNLYSVSAYDFTDSSVFVEVVSASSAPNSQTLLYVYDNANPNTRKVAIRQFSSYLDFIFQDGGSESVIRIAYNSVDHRWWRLRNAGGTTYWEGSPDGKVWTTFRTATLAFPITNVGTQLTSGKYASSQTTSTAVFDNFNTYTSRYKLISSVSGGGKVILNSETAHYSIVSKVKPGGRVLYNTVFQAIPGVDYEYRVFDENWNYLSTWTKEVKSDFGYSQRVNENASDLSVLLARSPDNRVVRLTPLKDENGNSILDSNSDTIIVQTETENSVGEGTDVRENLNVEVYKFYGGYELLQDTMGNNILDQNNDPILSQYGAPNGKRVYSGYIADYELLYGEQTGVNVIVVPHATEQMHYVFKNALGNTTVKYLNTDPVLMGRNAMDNYISQGGYITYTPETMPLSGQSVDYEFKLQTTREVQDKAVDLLPSGYYHFVDPGENYQYMKMAGTTANHTFIYGKHIKTMNLRKSITKLINDVYFVGGETSPGVYLYKHREDATSKTNIRPGLERLSDSRVTLDSSAVILSDRQIEEFKTAKWRTQIEITDAVYDIELIKLGHMVGFQNFGTATDKLLLMIVAIDKRKHSVVLDLDMTLPNEAKRLQELKKAILNEQIRDIGNTPA